MFLRLLFLVVLLAVAELALLVQAGRHWGGWPVLGIVLLTAWGGAILTRHQRRGARRAVAQALAEGRVPAVELLDSLLLVAAGLLLFLPGFLCDLAGLLLLIPPARHWLSRRIVAYYARRIAAGSRAAAAGFAARPPPAARSDVIDVEATVMEPRAGDPARQLPDTGPAHDRQA